MSSSTGRVHGPVLPRTVLWLIASLWIGCAPTPPPVEQPKPAVTTEAWYGEAVTRLAGMSRQAEDLLNRGQNDRAASIITEAQPLSNRLLTASRPTLAAMEAVSDMDDLYGRMLLRNRHYGWARSFFQKNVARWKHWQPQTDSTAERLRTAQSRIAECDRLLSQ